MLGSNAPAFRQFQNDEKKEIKDTGRVLKDCYKICPKCWNFTNYFDNHKYCHICGTVFLDECPECKEPIIYPNSKFCPMCGKSF
jgi:hypothetical protein